MPALAEQTFGKATRRIYDSLGRLERNSIYINTTEHSYALYEYPTNGIQSKVYSTIVDTNSDGADADYEVLRESWTDGAERVIGSRTEHPDSTGGWSAVRTEFDILAAFTKQACRPRCLSLRQTTPNNGVSHAKLQFFLTAYTQYYNRFA